MHLCIIVSVLLCIIISIRLTSYHYINQWFNDLLCIFCMMNVVRMWQGNIVRRNISDVTEGVHWVRLQRPRGCAFQKEYKKRFFHLVLLHFNFWPATCPFRRVAKIIENKSFKENVCSIGMPCALVWFRLAHLQMQPP